MLPCLTTSIIHAIHGMVPLEGLNNFGSGAYDWHFSSFVDMIGVKTQYQKKQKWNRKISL